MEGGFETSILPSGCDWLRSATMKRLSKRLEISSPGRSNVHSGGNLTSSPVKKRTRSATSVQVEVQPGILSESSTKETVKDAIFCEVHNKQYTQAKEAPICSGKLFDDFGYVANTPASKAVLDGTYQPPPNSDQAMAELFDEITAIRRIVPKDLASPVILPEQWKWYWAVVNEETSLSESGLHFGHYIIGCKSEIVAHYHAAQVSVVLAHAIQLER
jgi:hypothetical protein